MKDKKININVGYEKLSKEEVDSHKDFKKVYESYLTTNIKPMKVAKKYTITRLVIVASVATVVTVSVWKYSSMQHAETKIKPVVHTSVSHTSTTLVHTETQKKPFIHPPIKGADVPYKSYIMDAAKGGVLTYNKSKITIPAHALCDEKGNEVKGNVTINYREFHDAIDFFVSGIPMTYDSAGTKYNFESAGMLDIQGSQNGKPVYVKQGKNIQVAMSSFQTGTKYNVYRLDTVKKNWTYIEKSKYTVQQTKMSAPQQGGAKGTIATPSPLKTEIATISTALTKLEAEKPVKANATNYQLNIDADTTQFPELAMFKNVLFEVDSKDKEYNPEWEKENWSDAKLNHATNGKDYVLVISNGSVKHNILVHPAFAEKDYTIAMKEYDKKYTQYLVKIEEKKREEEVQKEQQAKLMAEMEKKQEEEKKKQLEIAQQQKVAMLKIQKQQAVGVSAEGTVMNYFTVNSFGFWNSDNPTLPSEKTQLAAQYTDNQDDDLNNVNTYLIQKDRNAIVDNHPGHKCCFDPSERNFAWAITPDQKLAIYSEEDFKKIIQTSGNYTFVMKVMDVQIATYNQVRNALEPYMN